jgi:hypothetical protein
MRRYVWCLLGVIGVLCVVGMLMLYTSTAYAYEAAKLDQSSEDLSGEIASLESVYKDKTANFISQGAHRANMVRYSPGSREVRYAQVGGAVYSMLSQRGL